MISERFSKKEPVSRTNNKYTIAYCMLESAFENKRKRLEEICRNGSFGPRVSDKRVSPPAVV